MFSKELRMPVYAIYGFVRFADEIVDTFHDKDKNKLLADFRNDTFKAISEKISLNPVLHTFQEVVNKYQIDHSLIDAFLESMRMDLEQIQYNSSLYKEYILGSAEVVGLMCLQVFTEGNQSQYNALKDTAMSLGAAFQKINFLRDIKDDNEQLGRTYFPSVNFNSFSNADKIAIEQDIANDFNHALQGIKQLPSTSKFGVYVAYCYYWVLFRKIKSIPAKEITQTRIRVSNFRKLIITFQSYLQVQLRWV